MPDAGLPPYAPLEESRAYAPQTELCVQDISLTLGGRTVLERISLRLGAEGCTVLLGPNGAGKTLLLKVLHGVLAPSCGTVSWSGTPATEATARQAFVFQKPVLLRRSVRANLDFVLRARGMDRKRALPLLEHVGLAEKASLPARLLSGGEQQRLSLARALATEPDVLFLDEPTANLDPASVLLIERIVADARDRGVRIFFVTHDIGQARRMADDVVFLHRGKLVEKDCAHRFFPVPRAQAARDHLDGKIVI